MGAGFIEHRPAHAGHTLLTIVVDDLDAFAAVAVDRGVEPAKRETYPNGVRKADIHDPDGNELSFGVVSLPTEADGGWQLGYTLEAIIGSAGALRAAVSHLPAAVLVPLAQDLALVPMTDELFDAVTDGTTQNVLGFWALPGGFDRELTSWSSAGPVGYVEADFFGGVGSQRSALWVAGELVFGPLHVGPGEPFPPEGSPIAQMLARLGVERDGHRDEFEAIGLGRHRETADWLP